MSFYYSEHFFKSVHNNKNYKYHFYIQYSYTKQNNLRRTFIIQCTSSAMRCSVSSESDRTSKLSIRACIVSISFNFRMITADVSMYTIR